MTTVIAYAISVLLNLGVITARDVNTASNSLTVIERDGQTVVVDSNSGTEVIISF